VSDSPPKIERLEEFLSGESLEVEREIAPGDPMNAFQGGRDLYFVAGQSALRAINLSLLAARRDHPPGQILDFACGAGRVLRTLKAAFPDAALTASDTWGEGVEFCTRVLGATGVVSSHDAGKIELDGPFDLIWCGSFLTHVDRDQWVAFLRLFESLLAPDGVLVFTTYGRFAAQNLRDGTNPLTLDDRQVAQVLRDYDANGFGFCANIAPDLAHGESVASPEWVCNLLADETDLSLLLYLEQGWLGVQDVVACNRR
jgi:SAM-dependent methyltransferase